MRTLALGDIHGCFRALSTLAAYVPIGDDDLIVALGDYVDRGPDSQAVVEWVRKRTRAGRCVPIKGNHEIMMLSALRGEIPMQHWLQFGGEETLDSYAPARGRRGRPEDVSDEHLRFLYQDLLPVFETETEIFVHATLAPNLPPQRQSEEDLFWGRFDWIAPHVSGKRIVCGHTAQRNGLPNDLGFAVCIDTWAYGDGWLTCLNLESGQYWQANEQGQTRQSELRWG